MPLNKRILFDPASYHKKDVFEESTADSFLPDHNMSRMFGTIQQLAYLSAFSLEIFQNLSVLSEDLGERIHAAAVRTNTLYDELKSVDRKVSSMNDEDHMSAVPGMAKYLQTREMFTPQLFNKATNFSSISQQYRICRAPPQLWRIEVFTNEDCFRNFSNPGVFFQEWIRSEIIRQQVKKEEKKRLKQLKKLQRQERKKLKEAAIEEELYNTMYSSASISASASANVSLSGLTSKRNKSMLAARSAQSVDGDSGAAEHVSAVAQSDVVREPAERDDGAPGEEEQEGAEGDERVTSAIGQDKRPKKSKGGSAGSKAVKSASAGLAKLFNRKPKALFPSVEEEGADPAPDHNTAPMTVPSANKTESMAKQLLEITTEQRRSEDEAEGDGLVAGQGAGRPMSYLDELATAANGARRRGMLAGNSDSREDRDSREGRDGGAFHGLQQVPDRESLLAGGAGPDAPTPTAPLPGAAQRNKKAAVTMKIGSKFLSAAPVGGKSGAAPARSPPTVRDSPEAPGRAKESRRRGSSTGNVVTEASAAGAAKGHTDSLNWESQRATSTGNLLLKPPPPPPPFAGPTVAGEREGRRTSFSLGTKGEGADGAAGESRLLPNRHRASLTLSQAAVAESIFDRSSRGLRGDTHSGVPKESGFDSGALRRRSLLSLLEEEVLEELGGQDRTARPNHAPLLTGAEEYRERTVEMQDGSDPDADSHAASEESPPVSEGKGEEEGPPSEGGSDGSDGDELPPSDDEAEDEPEPPRPSQVRATGAAPPPPPPPPPPPLQQAMGRPPLSEGLLGALKSGAAGAALKRTEPQAEAARPDERTQLLRSIQLGAVQLKSAAAAGNKPKPLQNIVKQNEAVAAILANRSKIAGSDTESSDGSDSDYTDDGY